MKSTDVLNSDSQWLLGMVFGADWAEAWVAWKGNWTGKRVAGLEAGDMPDGQDCYFCPAWLKADVTTRSNANAERVMVLVIDDVGTKIDLEAFEMAFPLEPTYSVETSRGNFQYGYAMAEPGLSLGDYGRLRKTMKANAIWGRSDGVDPVHLFRLPQGTNTKEGNEGWKVRLANPAAPVVHAPERVLEAFGVPQVDAGPGVSQVTDTDTVEWGLGAEALGALVDLIPNPLGMSREVWLGVAHGIAAAGGGFEIFDGFSSRWEGAVDDAETVRVWETLGEDHLASGGNLRAMAEAADADGFGAWKQRWETKVVFDDGVDVEAEALGLTPVLDKRLSLDQFVAYQPMHKFIYTPTGDLWTKDAVTAVLAPVVVGTKADGSPRTMPAAKWLALHKGVSQMSWIPGMAEVIKGYTISMDGLKPHPPSNIYNQYRAPDVLAGDAGLAGPWLDHVRKLYPYDEEVLLNFFAHAVQKPAEKVNYGVLLGGSPGIGKDTMLHPVLRAVGLKNTCSVSPTAIREAFNAYLKSVVLVIDEIRDLGDSSQWAFYEQTKTLLAAPPHSLLVNEKFKPAYPVPNVVHVVMTTNSKFDGLYLPEDDRRHYVAWSDMPAMGEAGCSDADYFRGLWGWMEAGGCGHVAAFLRARDLKGYDPKESPPRTKTFLAMVRAGQFEEVGLLSDALDLLGRPGAFTKEWLVKAGSEDLVSWLLDKKNMRHFPKRLEKEGYEAFPNPDEKMGRWPLGGRRHIVYVARSSSFKEREGFIKGMEDAERSAMEALTKAAGGPKGPAADAFK